MSDRVTIHSIKVAEFNNYVSVLKKSADKRKIMIRYLTLSDSFQIADELIQFRCTGLIPHAHVRRSQRNKIIRCMIATFTLVRAHIYDIDAIIELDKAIGKAFDVYPYLYDQFLIDEITKYYLYY